MSFPNFSRSQWVYSPSAAGSLSGIKAGQAGEPGEGGSRENSDIPTASLIQLPAAM